MADEKRAIVMLSIGNRGWARKSSATFARYAAVVGADMHLITEFPSSAEFPFPALPDSPGRKMKLAYACKAFFAWKFLEVEGYDRVAVVDDTCCVRAGAPDIFEAVPRGACGYTGTSGSHAELSFDVIKRFVKKNGLPDIDYESRLYMNSGVMVYDSSFKEALHKDKICEASDLLFAKYPNQTLTYYLLRRAGVPMTRISKSFNSIPAMRLPKEARRMISDISPYVTDATYIYHVTGAFKNRGAVVEQLSDILLRAWDLTLPDFDVVPEDEYSGEIVAAYNTNAPTFSYINNGLRRIAVDPSDKRARAQLLRHGRRYQSKIQNIVLSLQMLMDIDIFIDVGVNYGECLFSTPPFSRTMIYGYEANPALYPFIERSLRYNDDLKNVTIVRKGVSNTVGTMDFFIDTEWSGQSTAVKKTGKSSKRVKQIHIDTTTLDQESASWGDWKTGLIKVDVEGFEPEVLEGARGIIRSGKNIFFLIEFDTSYMTGTDRIAPQVFFERLKNDFSVYLVRTVGLEKISNFDDLKMVARESGRIHCDLLLLKVGEKTLQLFEKNFAGRPLNQIASQLGA